MPRIPPLRTGLLDLAAAIGLAGPAIMTLYSVDLRPVGLSTAVTALLVAAVIVWVLWRRSGQRSRLGALAFAGIAVATIALGNGSLFYGIVWTACLVLGITFTRALVLWAYAAGLVVIVIVLHSQAGSTAEAAAAEAIATALLAGLGAAVSVVLRDSLRVGEDLRDALRRLDAANAELRRRLESDRDLVLAHERERTARELHDDLGHRLTAIGFSLEYAARVDDPASARDELARARNLVGESLDAMRRLVRAMHPVELGELRDAEAFRAVAEAFRGSGVDIRVSIDDDGAELSRDRTLLLLRFVQEGLTNVVRHANASTVDLRVSVDQRGVSAEIRDDGRTVAMGEPPADGFGLRSLRARAHELDGHLDAAPTPSGFRLALALPADSAMAAR